MSALLAILLVIIAVGMLIAYYIGYTTGHREGYECGHADGKRAGSVRAYAVGYDRGRHNRKAAVESAEQDPGPPARRKWARPVIVSLILIVLSTLVAGSRIDFR